MNHKQYHRKIINTVMSIEIAPATKHAHRFSPTELSIRCVPQAIHSSIHAEKVQDIERSPWEKLITHRLAYGIPTSV